MEQGLLENEWCFWTTKNTGGEFHDRMEMFASFKTVSEFWKIYLHLKRPSTLEERTDLFLFKKGIFPEWEDENNIKGGSVLCRIQKEVSDIIWERLLLGVIREGFGNGLCGVVFATRRSDNVISAWIKSDEDINLTKKAFCTILEAKTEGLLEYRKHEVSLKMATGPNIK